MRSITKAPSGECDIAAVVEMVICCNAILNLVHKVTTSSQHCSSWSELVICQLLYHFYRLMPGRARDDAWSASCPQINFLSSYHKPTLVRGVRMCGAHSEHSVSEYIHVRMRRTLILHAKKLEAVSVLRCSSKSITIVELDYTCPITDRSSWWLKQWIIMTDILYYNNIVTIVYNYYNFINIPIKSGGIKRHSMIENSGNKAQSPK